MVANSLPAALVCMLLVAGLTPSLQARPFADEATLLAQSYSALPMKGPFQYVHLFNIDEDQEGKKGLALIFRGRASVLLRLKRPLRLTGFTSSIHLRAEGFRGGETIYALFIDRAGRSHRIAMGRTELYGFQDYSVDLRGKMRQRPQRLSEKAYIDFVGWSIEPDLRQAERSSYVILNEPVFDLRPYDSKVEEL